MEEKLSIEARMRIVFDDLARDDMDALISNWADDGVYFNPKYGPAAEGKASVKNTIASMSTALKANGEALVVDRITAVPDATPQRLYAEWHVQSDGPRDGKMGIHVVLFDEDGYLHRVTVFGHG